MDTLSLILLTTISPLACFAIAIIFLIQQPKAAQGLVLFGQRGIPLELHRPSRTGTC